MNKAGDIPWPRLAFVVVAAIGLGVSALLLFEYVTPAEHFCGDGGGCDRVRNSAYASLLGVPTPAFGVALFGVALVAVMWSRARRWVLALALVGALAAVAFLALQAFEIRAWCKYCVAADTAALLLAVLALVMERSPSEAELRLSVAVPAAAAFLALPVVLGFATGASSDEGVAGPLPEAIAREQREGVATIVEFLDFEFPYCRKQHETMTTLLAEYRDRVRVVYKNVPLSGHRYARGAARAWCCAEEQTKGQELANELFTSEDLSPEGCAKLAERVGVDMERYGECMESERPEQRLAADLEDSKAAGVRGLPTFYVGEVRMEGLKEEHVVRGAIEHALVAN
jgi:uncharacterized membrane protein/predicted DsbA family dithiol-disulfide isomerase